jgi:type IV secretion system protein VirB4
MRGFAQLEDALGSVVAGDYVLGWHQLSVMVISRDLEQLEDKVATVHHELLQSGLIPVRETMLTEPMYWSQFPGNHQYLFRKLTLHSGNMACMASFHTKTGGHRQSYWGDPLLLLRTPQRSSYWFNLHVGGRDIGDTLILGEKGSGKTLLLTTIATAALQYKPRIFFFDKDFGAECWFHAVNGNHAVLGTGESTGLNPLQLPDTPNNRRFLQQWLRSLLEAFGPSLTEMEDTLIHQSIKHNYEDLKPEQRTLSHLQSALGTGGPGTLRNRLRHWHSDGEYAFYFDNPKDTLEFNNPVTGFEMHYLLQDSQSQARLPVLLYLFHRIRMSLEAGDRRPTLIILDEAWSLLSNEFFAKEIKNWLLTLRKLNAITIFATQNPSDILNHAITPVLVAETVTKVLYRPNTPSPAVYQTALHLTEGEYQALCQVPTGSRAFLVKQPDHAVIAQLDLTGMDAYIPLLSSRPQQRQEFLANKAAKPNTWLKEMLNQKINKGVVL